MFSLSLALFFFFLSPPAASPTHWLFAKLQGISQGQSWVWWNACWKFLALAINVHNVQPVLLCATNIKLIISHFCLLGNTGALFIILFTISSEATPSRTHCPPPASTHTHTPANPTRGCSSLMKEKITHRQSGSHTKMPALHSAFFFSFHQILHKMSLTLFKVITFSRSECHGAAQLLSWQI